MKATAAYAARRIVFCFFGPGFRPHTLSGYSSNSRKVARSPFCTLESCGRAEDGALAVEVPINNMKGDGRGRGRGGRGGGAGNMRPGLRPVSETSRITIDERLKQFRASNDEKMVFEAGLSNHERAVIHELCRKMGMKSKSFGKGADRRLTVWKIGGQSQKNNQSVAASLVFSADTRAAIQHLFVNYPPTENESSWKSDETANAHSGKARSQNTVKIGTSVDSESYIKKQVSLLNKRLQSMPALRKITQEREKLPIAKFKDEIISTVEKNQVVLIAGETGCGKTTQVPQYILDSLWSQGKECRIICAQPRRISASSVAERIATERGEQIGQTVGYQIKLESKGGPHSSLMFCTNGVILRKLVNSDGDIRSKLNATHIIVDEIHERDCDTDFMLIALRDLLSLHPEMRLILMSATIDIELFSTYFNKCPVIRVPGFTYPVQSFFLEDVLMATASGEDCVTSSEAFLDVGPCTPLDEEDAATMDEAIGLAWLEDDFDLFTEMLSRNSFQSVCNYQHSLTGTTPLMVAAGKGRVSEVYFLLSKGADIDLVAQDGFTALDWAERNGKAEIKEILLNHKKRKGDSTISAKKSELLERYLSGIDQDEVDVKLIKELLQKICTTVTAGISPDHLGSILVFLPGWEDIVRTRECLEESAVFGDTKKFLILPLHSLIPSSEQRRVFQIPPPGVRKIILATNIAETAITINDVVFVVDTGRVKEKSYDAYSNVSTFQTAWISKASAKQREGRAGRCQPGVCYHLYSQVRANSLPDFKVPEIKRTSLEELCLQVKLLDSESDIRAFLSKAIEPPDDLSIANAIRLLQDIGALTSDERLTELGEQLGALPVHPSTSKMLLLGILLNCLGPALTIACASGYRDPFILPTSPEQRKKALAAKELLTNEYGGFSDDLAIVAAFRGWEAAKARNSNNLYCEKYFLSPSTMAMIAGMRQQLQNELAQKGFIPDEPNACSLNASDPGIVRALLVAGSYPMVGTLLPVAKGKKPTVQTAHGMKVKVHPHSLTYTAVNKYNMELNPYLVFDEVTRGEAWVYIRNCTFVKPHPLFLLSLEMVVAPLQEENDEDGDSSDSSDAEDMEVEHDLMSDPNSRVLVVVDRWLKFEATAVEAAQLYCLRERLAAAIAFKLKNPRKLLPLHLGHSVFTIACLLSYDGNITVKNDSKSRSSKVSRDATPATSELRFNQASAGSQLKGSSYRQNITATKSKQMQLGLKKSMVVTGHYIKRQRGDTLC